MLDYCSLVRWHNLIHWRAQRWNIAPVEFQEIAPCRQISASAIPLIYVILSFLWKLNSVARLMAFHSNFHNLSHSNYCKSTVDSVVPFRWVRERLSITRKNVMHFLLIFFLIPVNHTGSIDIHVSCCESQTEKLCLSPSHCPEELLYFCDFFAWVVLLHVSNASEMTIWTELEKKLTSMLVTLDALPTLVLQLLMELRGRNFNDWKISNYICCGLTLIGS